MLPYETHKYLEAKLKTTTAKELLYHGYVKDMLAYRDVLCPNSKIPGMNTIDPCEPQRSSDVIIYMCDLFASCFSNAQIASIKYLLEKIEKEERGEIEDKTTEELTAEELEVERIDRERIKREGVEEELTEEYD